MVRSHFSPYLLVFYVFRYSILLLHHSFHFPLPLNFGPSFSSLRRKGTNHLGNMLSPIRNPYPYYYNLLLSVFKELLVLLPFFYNYFISFNILAAILYLRKSLTVLSTHLDLFGQKWVKKISM